MSDCETLSRITQASVTVVDLNTSRAYFYAGISPREAVMAAYGQAMRNWSTWTYGARYGNRVVYGERSVACGSFVALVRPLCRQEV